MVIPCYNEPNDRAQRGVGVAWFITPENGVRSGMDVPDSSLTIMFSSDEWTVSVTTSRGVVVYSLPEILLLYGWLLEHSERLERAMAAFERAPSWVASTRVLALVA